MNKINIKLSAGKQSVSIKTDCYSDISGPDWLFCQNGYQSTGVSISREQFIMLRDLVTNREVVEFYESLPAKKEPIGA